MILDSLYAFDTSLVMVAGTTGAIGTTPSTNVISLRATGQIPVLANLQGARDMGIGDNPALKVSVNVVVALTSGGAATLSVAFQGAPDDGTGNPGTFATYYATPVYALATVAVVRSLMDIDVPRPPAGVGMPAYYRLAYIIAGATFTGGTLQSYLVLDRTDYIAYPVGLTVAN